MSERTLRTSRSAAESLASLSRNDRFAAVLMAILSVAAIALGLLLKQQNSAQIWHYESREAGIEADYPAGWLIDERGDYVVRIRDPKSRPFKSEFRISAVPAGGATSVRNVLDTFTLQRAADLSAYRVLNVREIDASGLLITEMNFAFVDADPNPFIQRLPVVVLGRDIVIIDGNRAIVVTYMADEQSFEENLETFQRFLVSLAY